MQSITKEDIERIYLTESSFDKLFDAFKYAMEKDLNDSQLIRQLLANPHLTREQITLFAETYIKHYPEHSYEIYLWTGTVLEQACKPCEKHEVAFNYYNKAAAINPHEYEPYANMLNLYDYEISRETNKNIIKTINDNLKIIKDKPKIFTLLSEHFKKLGDKQKQLACLKLATKFKK